MNSKTYVNEIDISKVKKQASSDYRDAFPTRSLQQ
jgi:hypothetical protein